MELETLRTYLLRKRGAAEDFPNGPTSRLQEKAGFLSSITFFVLYTGMEHKGGRNERQP